MSMSKGGLGGSKSGKGRRGGFGGGDRKRPYRNPHKNPMASVGAPTGDLEADSAKEVAAVTEAFSGFKGRAEKESQRFALAVDASFWSGICFRSASDCQKFFEAIGFTKFYRGQHVDGYALARHLGVKVDWDYPHPLKAPA